MKKYLFFVASVFLLSATQIFAQNAVGDASQKPFAVNESLLYEVKYNKAIFRGLLVGEFRFKVVATPESNRKAKPEGENPPPNFEKLPESKPSTQPPNQNTQTYTLEGEAISKGTLIRLFRQNINIKVVSIVDGTEFRILRSEKDDTQNERVRDSVSIFDYETKRVTFTETNPNEPNQPPRIIAAELRGTTHDIISAIYALRLLPFALGKTFTIDVSDTGVVHRIPVKVIAREQIKTELGKFWAWRIVPEVFGERGLVQGEGDMTIWITDDSRRLPVRSRVNSDLGRVEIRIKTAQNLVSLKK